MPYWAKVIVMAITAAVVGWDSPFNIFVTVILAIIAVNLIFFFLPPKDGRFFPKSWSGE